jgi:hypothetical protein
MASAWPEPPDAMSVDPSAGARCGAQGTFAIVGFIETIPEPSRGALWSLAVRPKLERCPLQRLRLADAQW